MKEVKAFWVHSLESKSIILNRDSPIEHTESDEDCTYQEIILRGSTIECLLAMMVVDGDRLYCRYGGKKTCVVVLLSFRP